MDLPTTGLPDLIVGSLLTVVGLVALAGSLLRQRRADPLLAAFGAFALLWGVRQFFSSELIGWVGFSSTTTAWITNLITYLIIVPAWIFFWRVLGPGWRGMLGKWSVLAAVFALCGVLSDVIQGTPGTLAGVPNNIIVLFGMAIAILSLLEYRHRMTPDLRVLGFGLAFFGAFAANANLVGMGVLPWSWSEESIGFVVFVTCLGFIAARRTVAGKAQLAALQSELETAREIQLAILPEKIPATPGLEIAVRFRPTSAVAGDLYDFLRPESGGLGVFLADVSGHGVPAALIASMVKVAVASRVDSASRPDELLAGVNRTLCGNIQRGFVTAAYVFFPPDGDQIRIATGGHPFPLLARAGAPAIAEVGGRGPILGRFPTAVFAESRLRMAPGDRLVLYTDGLVEARDPKGEPLGDSRLLSLLNRHRTDSAHHLSDALLAELERWSGRPGRLALDDDLTLIVTDRTSSPPPG